MVKGVSHYADLVPAEVENYVSMQLRVATVREDYLTCLYCRNAKRKQKLFQGSNEVRAHYDDHRKREVGQPDAAGPEPMAMEAMGEATSTDFAGRPTNASLA